MISSPRLCILLGLLVFSITCVAQTDWQTVPWQTIGKDSAQADLKNNILVTGTVRNMGSGESVSGATISVDSHKYFDYTDNKGQYVLEMPRGDYRISVRHIGMKPRYFRLKVLSGGVFDVSMEEGIINLEELVIMARPINSNVKQAISGLTTMSLGEIKTLPTLLGEVYIVKSLQLMPGVSSVGEAASGFNVRGGRPDQNLMLLNDAPIFNTSHALGFVSAFNQDIIRDFSLYKGSVPSQYGGRASSVLEINTRRGDNEKWSYQGGIGPITARFSAEGPIQKSKTSLLLSGRVAYPNWMLKQASDPNVSKSSAAFNDAFVSIAHRINENSSVEASIYQSHDGFQFSDRFGYVWNNFLAQTKWTGLANRKASPSVSMSYGQFNTTLIDPVGQSASELKNALSYVQIKPYVNYIPNDKHSITAGAESMIYLPKDEHQDAYQGSAFIPKKVNKDNGWEAAIFLNDEYQINERISVSAGLRLSGYVHLGADTIFQYENGQPRAENTIVDSVYYSSFQKIKTYGGLEPRLAVRVNTFRDQSVKVSYSRMRQYIHQISNTASATPVDIWQVSTGYLPPQVADHYSVGYFWNLNDNEWETSVEGFYKKMQNLVEYKDFPNLYVNRHIETELLTGQGRAYGGEIYLRRLKGRWTGWVSYTYSQTEVKVASAISEEAINNGAWYPSNYNKPNIFNLVLNKKTYRNGAFSIIASYASGRPLTAIESSYIVNGAVVPIYSKRNQYRIPDYFRVDLSFTIGNIIKKIDDSLVFSIYNFFGRDNAYSVFYQRPTSNYFIPKPYQLSILGAALPSLTYNFKF
ncbi:MAG: hypothetical protein RI909_449 [Bacteroidota bacterium]